MIKKPIMVVVEYDVAEDCEVPFKAKVSRHTCKVVGVIKKWMKHDFRIVSLPEDKALKWIYDHKDEIFVITASVTYLTRDFLYKRLKDTVYMCAASGNSGEKGEAPLAMTKHFTAISAVDENYKFEEYSSYGKGAVEFAGIIPKETIYKYNGMTAYGDYDHMKGTSFACPQHATEVMNLMCDYYECTGERLPIKEVLRIRNKHTKDLLEEGKDLKTGYGVYSYTKKQIPDELDYIKLKERVSELEPKVYNTLEEVPSWARKDLSELVDKGVLKGTDEGLNLTLSDIRLLILSKRMINS